MTFERHTIVRTTGAAVLALTLGLGCNFAGAKSQDNDSHAAVAAQEKSLDTTLFVRPGFYTQIEDGRLWVFREGSKELAEFKEHGEPAKQVVRPGAGPLGVSIKGPDAETITAYLISRPGFYTQIEDGRLWVFREGSKELAEFKEHGEPAKQVVRPGVGPMGMTVKGPDTQTINDYLIARHGFYTQIEDGRLWVFREGSKELAAFKEHGEPAKQVVRPGAGPLGMTIKGPDTETLDTYMKMR